MCFGSLERPSLSVAAGMLLVVSGAAQGAAPGEWQMEATPYLWLAGLKGDTQIGASPQANIDLSPSDVLDKLDFGLMGTFEARKGRWGVFLDGVYAKLSDSAGGSISLRGGPGVNVNADATVKQTIFSAALQYRAVEGTTPVDLIFGGRYNKVDLQTTVSAVFFGPLGVTRSPSYEKSWWDPYVGVRVTHPLTDRLSAVVYADVGGFGVGSETTWQALVGANYSISKTMTAKFGYRYLHTDYDNDSFRFKVDMSGVYLGLGIRF